MAVLCPLLSGLLTLFLPRGAVTMRVAVATAGMLGAFGLLWWTGNTGDPTSGTLAWIPALHLNLAFLSDGLGLFFGLLVSGIGVMISLYARGYFGPDADELYRFYPTNGFFATAMLGVVLSDYTLQTMLFWEMTSISSFLLIGWDRYDKESVRLAMQAFFTTGLGGMGLLGGVLLFGMDTGVWRWSQMLAMGPEAFDLASPMMIGALVLMFIGAATKSAQFPFHYWLPGAMAAPTPVSAYLHSATMVKAGVFLMGRLFPVFAAVSLWPSMLVIFGSLTMVYGAAHAILKHDLKQIFAFTTVSQLGLLMAMYGLGAFHYEHDGHVLSAIDLDITQIANHAFYKAPLFIAAGAIGHVASRKLPELHGAFKKHRMICLTMMLAALGLAAVPGTVSFQAKELFLYAIKHAAHEHPWLWVVMVMTVATAVVNVAIATRIWVTLLGIGGSGGSAKPHAEAHAQGGHAEHGEHHEHAQAHEHEHEHERGFGAALAWLPGLLIVSLQFVGGLFTPLWNAMFHPLERHGLYFEHVPALWELHLGLPLLLSMVALAGGVVLGLSMSLRGVMTDVCNRVYPAMYWLAVTGGGRAFGLIQRGHLRFYVLAVLAAFGVAFVAAVWLDDSMRDLTMMSPVLGQVAEYWPGLLLGVFVCLTSLAIPMTKVRVVRVVFLGACGFSVVGMYVVYQAPDLALTQLMFEIISVILFVLVLRLLPKQEKRADGQRLVRAVIGLLVGVAFGWATLVAASTWERNPDMPRMGEVHAMNSYQGMPLADGTYIGGSPRGGGGDNIVNVILVDFRGWDTMGEITVLALATMGVWSMLPRHRHTVSQGVTT